MCNALHFQYIFLRLNIIYVSFSIIYILIYLYKNEKVNIIDFLILYTFFLQIIFNLMR